MAGERATLTKNRHRTVRVAAIVAAALVAGSVAQAAEFDCMLEPKRVVTISGSIEALITTVRVERGDLVRKGDVLVEFESGVERASSDLAKYRAEMQGAVDARRARTDYAQARHRRTVELTKKNFVSPQDVEEAAAEKRLAEAELREALDSRRIAELEQRRTTEILKLRTLRSPIAGVVVDRYMNPGEISEIGAKPILKLAEIGTLHVETILPAAAYGQVAIGDVGVVRPETPVGSRFEAKVIVVDRVLDAASGTFGVRLELPNESRNLPAGARCKVDLAKVKAAPPRPSRTQPPAVRPAAAPAARSN
jgi:RND family efflux transporter MFP subunit